MNLLLDKKNGSKQLIFSVLTTNHPLKLIEIANHLKRRYGKDITFQAVRKAALELVEQEIIKKEDQKYEINLNWILEQEKNLKELYSQLTIQKPKRHEKIEGMATYSFDTLNELIIFWQDRIDEWFKSITKKGTINCYQAAHAWEGLLHLEKEKKIMGQLKKKGVKSHILINGNSLLDRNIAKFYENLGIKVKIHREISSFDKSYYVGTYGDLIIQTTYPKKIVKLLDEFFQKNTTLEEFDLEELSRIVNTKAELKLTIIKDKNMAEQINKSILALM